MHLKSTPVYQGESSQTRAYPSPLPLAEISYLSIPETWPSMSSTFRQELVHGATDWSSEEQLSSIAVKELHLTCRSQGFLLELVSSLKISTEFGIMAIEITDFVGFFGITFPTKISLDRTIM